MMIKNLHFVNKLFLAQYDSHLKIVQKKLFKWKYYLYKKQELKDHKYQNESKTVKKELWGKNVLNQY